jgi:hypothetical protein
MQTPDINDLIDLVEVLQAESLNAHKCAPRLYLVETPQKLSPATEMEYDCIELRKRGYSSAEIQALHSDNPWTG